MFEFEYLELGFLALVPIFLKIFKSLKRQNNLTQIIFPNLNILESAFGGSINKINKKISLKEILIYLMWISLVLTIMGPQFVNKRVEHTSKGRNIIIAADLSGSMRALDFSTKDKYITRLEIVQQTTSSFLEKRIGDKIGLVLFGDHAYLHVPLTSDLKSVAEMLNKSFIGMAGESTAIGDAIGLSVKKLRDIGNQEASTIILLTDGENTSGELDPIDAANIAKEYNIKIYVIGIGTTGYAPIINQRGRIVRANVRLDENTLKRVAHITNGQYFNVTNKDIMSQIYDKIDELEKIENETRDLLIKKPLYRIPLITAMFILILLAIIPFFQKRSFRYESI